MPLKVLVPLIAAITRCGQLAAAFSGPQTGRYACYSCGFNMQSFYDLVTVVIEQFARYYRGAHFTGVYNYAGNGR